ncbi:MAG: J domain-containing protein [Bradymonadia bacterium]|jgi:curved DNA-binding protein CbpA
MEKIQELRHFYENMQGKNAFELLGLSADTDDDAVRARYSQLIKKFHPDRFGREDAEALVEILSAVNAGIREAYDAISSQERRELYARVGEFAGEEIDLGEIFALEKARDHGVALFSRGEYALAHTKLLQALELTPNDAQIKAYIYFCEYIALEPRADGRRKREDVERCIAGLEALAQKKTDVESRLQLGRIMKLEGRMDVAQRYFEAVDTMTQHSNAEAARELRLMQDRLRRAQNTKKDVSILDKIKSLFIK